MLSRRTPLALRTHLRLPLIAAPMLYVSGPALVAAACRAGIIGAFPALNPRLAGARSLDEWLCEIGELLADTQGAHGPICVNIIMHGPEVDAHVDCVIRHKVPLVVTSVGSPRAAAARLREAGVLVFSDVASLAHARKAIEAGVDGLVLLSAGAGGHTGWLNGLAFARAVRSMFEGPIVLAGGVCDGAALMAARVLDCDFGYMGTPFVATTESLASETYKERLLTASMDDIVLTKAFSGLLANYLRSSIVASGYDPDNLGSVDPDLATIASGASGRGPRRWTEIQSAGHSVSAIEAVTSVAALVERIAREYQAAARRCLA